MSTVPAPVARALRITDAFGDYVTLEVRGRQFPQSDDFWDGNWLDTPLTIHVGSFDAQVSSTLRTNELLKFKEELEAVYRDNAGTAVLSTMEGWLLIEVVADGLGHLQVTGHLRDEVGGGYGNDLNFELRGLDQTWLPPVLASLEEVLATYPVVGR